MIAEVFIGNFLVGVVVVPTHITIAIPLAGHTIVGHERHDIAGNHIDVVLLFVSSLESSGLAHVVEIRELDAVALLNHIGQGVLPIIILVDGCILIAPRLIVKRAECAVGV